MVRFVSVQHRFIELDLELSDANGKKLISSGAKGFEDSIFAQLDEGEYVLTVVFLSEAIHLRQPCQTIQMEIAIMPLSEARDSIYD